MGFNWFDTTVCQPLGSSPLGSTFRPERAVRLRGRNGDPGHPRHHRAGKRRSDSEHHDAEQSIVPVPDHLWCEAQSRRPRHTVLSLRCKFDSYVATSGVGSGLYPPLARLSLAGLRRPLGFRRLYRGGQGTPGGTLSFNANDGYVVPGSGDPPNNYDCSFVSNPGEILPPYANSSGATASEFADGTSNSLASLTSTGLGCDSALAAGSGYSTSGVQYGSGDAQSYLITTGLVSSATGIVPVGGMSTCNLLEQASAPPKLLVSTLATLTAVQEDHGRVCQGHQYQPG